MHQTSHRAVATTLLLIRHGETAWNAERRLQGHLDITLNPEGERQASALGSALAKEHIDLVISSDLTRARQTAQAIVDARGPATLPLQLDAGLRERCYGGFEGLLYSEIAQRYPEAFAAWQARDVDALLPPGQNCGETFRAFYQRIIDTVASHAQRHPRATLALVAHGGVLECVYRAAQGMPLASARNFKVHNASINRFVFEAGQLRLLSWGEVDHLRHGVLDDLP